MPGCVSAVSGGAAELQQLLDNIEEQSDSLAAATAAGGAGVSHTSHSSHSSHPVVIDWVAPWAAASLAASQQLQALAATCRHLPVITVDVTASAANNAVALEKVMEVPQVYRKGGRQFHAVPKSGEGWLLGGRKGGDIARGTRGGDGSNPSRAFLLLPADWTMLLLLQGEAAFHGGVSEWVGVHRHHCLTRILPVIFGCHLR